MILRGTIGQYGVKLTYTEQPKPQTVFTLVCEEPGKDSHTFRVYIPVLIVEPQAGALAERLEPGDMVLREGKLVYRTGKMKESGKLVMMCFAVERLNAAAMAVSAE